MASVEPDKLEFQVPKAEDGYLVNKLVEASPPLDPNSIYCNLLQCSHFADTAVVVREGEELVGFATGYLEPRNPSTLFVWQVGIAKSARGKGLAKRMLKHLLKRSICQDVRYIETTITADNEASWALFRSLTRDLDTELDSRVHFEKDRHFGGEHDDEHLLVIGPFNTADVKATD